MQQASEQKMSVENLILTGQWETIKNLYHSDMQLSDPSFIVSIFENIFHLKEFTTSINKELTFENLKQGGEAYKTIFQTLADFLCVHKDYNDITHKILLFYWRETVCFDLVKKVIFSGNWDLILLLSSLRGVKESVSEIITDEFLDQDDVEEYYSTLQEEYKDIESRCFNDKTPLKAFVFIIKKRLLNPTQVLARCRDYEFFSKSTKKYLNTQLLNEVLSHGWNIKNYVDKYNMDTNDILRHPYLYQEKNKDSMLYLTNVQ